jgi:serine/threonine-protein kinase
MGKRILLGDFGIARNIGDNGGLAAANITVDTFPYAAPEQLTGEPLDGRADQYALAATAYHLLTGSTLFPHSNSAVVISHHLTVPPPALAKIRPKLTAFDPVLAIALTKDLPTDSPGARISPARSQRQDSRGRRQPWLRPCLHPWRTGHLRAQQCPRPRLTPTSRNDTGRWRIFAAASTVIAPTAVGAIAYAIENDNTDSKQGPPAASPTLARAQRAPKCAPSPAPARRDRHPAPTSFLSIWRHRFPVSVSPTSHAQPPVPMACAPAFQNGESPADAAAALRIQRWLSRRKQQCSATGPTKPDQTVTRVA